MKRTIFFIVIAAFLNACAQTRIPSFADLPDLPEFPDLGLPRIDKIPFIHRIDIQQGNIVTQNMMAQLVRGMDRKKVRYIMGTPIIQDTFNGDRWDYVYTFQEGGGEVERRRISLVFVDDLLDRAEGNVTAARGQLVADLRQDTTVLVPLAPRKGILLKIKDSMPFIGNDDDDWEPGVAPGNTDDETIAGVDGTEQEVIIPEDAPLKEKGFFRSMLDKVGLGADDEDDSGYDPGDPKYRDPTNPQS